MADIRSSLSLLPVAVNVGQPISHRLDHMLSGVRTQLALKVYGPDLDALRAVAEGLRAEMAGIEGIVDLQVEKQVHIPQLEIRVDYDRAALYGIQPRSPRRWSGCRMAASCLAWWTARGPMTSSCACLTKAAPRRHWGTC